MYCEVLKCLIMSARSPTLDDIWFHPKLPFPTLLTDNFSQRKDLGCPDPPPETPAKLSVDSVDCNLFLFVFLQLSGNLVESRSVILDLYATYLQNGLMLMLV